MNQVNLAQTNIYNKKINNIFSKGQDLNFEKIQIVLKILFSKYVLRISPKHFFTTKYINYYKIK